MHIYVMKRNLDGIFVWTEIKGRFTNLSNQSNVQKGLFYELRFFQFYLNIFLEAQLSREKAQKSVEFARKSTKRKKKLNNK